MIVTTIIATTVAGRSVITELFTCYCFGFRHDICKTALIILQNLPVFHSAINFLFIIKDSF